MPLTEPFRVDEHAFMEFADNTERTKQIARRLVSTTDRLSSYILPEYRNSTNSVMRASNALYNYSVQMSKAVDNISVDLKLTINSINDIIDESIHQSKQQLHKVENFL